tara:strand:+ start:201 stop:878 length:678 start_codon:yes stop_codon:yes gene_type:complete
MELSEQTIGVLRNYATINPNIVVAEGNNLKTISVARNVLSSATVSENFPKEFGIYDLNEFLNVLTLVDKPHLTFEDDFVTVGDQTGRSAVKYYYSDPEMLTSSNKDVTMPDAEVTFVLDSDTLNKIRRAAGALGHNEISISNTQGAVRVSVIDSDNATSNIFSIDVEGSYPEGVNFKFIMNVNNLKVVSEDFDVQISSKLISRFTSRQSDIEYYIALEKSSTYGE